MRPRSSGALLVYGATGYMGDLAVRALLRGGRRPLLSGRNRDRLERMAAALGLEYRCANLEDEAELGDALAGVAVLLNAAGPFSATWQPLTEACLRHRVHYLDLTGEVLVFEQIRTRGLRARRNGVLLLPGVGFDVVPSDCLAAYVAAQLPGASVLRIAVSGLEMASRGSARTLAEQAGRAAFVRRAGRLTPIPPGSLERAFDYGSGPASSVAVSWGDLATAFDTTAIPNIETYFEATPSVRTLVAASRVLFPILSEASWQTPLSMLTAALPAGPPAEDRASRSAVIVAEAQDPSGRAVRARLRTPEAYTLSAETAAAIAGEVLAGDYEPGFQTPARLFGADYILKFDGVTREPLAS